MHLSNPIKRFHCTDKDDDRRRSLIATARITICFERRKTHSRQPSGARAGRAVYECKTQNCKNICEMFSFTHRVEDGKRSNCL